MYQKFIGKIQDDTCPACSLDAQSVKHLFDCPAKPTTLSELDLWENPREVAHFLRTLPEFADLPPPEPPPPPQPPDSPLPFVVLQNDPTSPVFTPVTLPPSPDAESLSLFSFSFSSLDLSLTQDYRDLSPVRPRAHAPSHGVNAVSAGSTQDGFDSPFRNSPRGVSQR